LYRLTFLSKRRLSCSRFHRLLAPRTDQPVLPYFLPSHFPQHHSHPDRNPHTALLIPEHRLVHTKGQRPNSASM
jgi:hypothetical protein